MNRFVKLAISFCLIATGSITAWAQNGLNIERKQLFDSNWKFNLGDTPDAASITFDDTNWRNLDLPHDWSIEGKLDANNPMKGAGGYFPAGVGWYRKNFNVPANWQGKRISLYFEGVYMNSEVFINGKSVGMHPYGYTSFVHDLTPYLHYNQTNQVAVRVDNSQQINCRWYSGSGIYRHVWLTVTHPVHLAQWGTYITTPKVTAQKATVRVKTVVKNETSQQQQIIVETMLTDKNSGSDKLAVELLPNSEKEVIQTITVNNPQRWTPETPVLYQAKTIIRQQNNVLDVARNSFGIRSLKFSAEKGFQLNGKTVKISGACVHHDNGCLGAAAYDRAEERRVQQLKAAGFNLVRTSHNPPSEAFLNACDRLGLMVIDEAFDGWKASKTPHDYSTLFNDWWQRDLESMLLRDRNHPSVIMWSIGNEIIERTKPEAVVIAKNMTACAHKIDPTRPVTSAMTTWNEGWAVFDSLMAAHDVCGYNYQLHEAEADHKRVPSRVIIQTESYPREAFKNWNAVQSHDYVIGDIVWTGLDYLGESGIGRWYYPGEPKGEHWEHDFFPWHGGYCGDVDLLGWRKPISHYRNLLWNNTEKLYLAVREPNPMGDQIKETMWSVWPTWESWTWPGREGQNIDVEVYSKYQSVRLYLNNKLIAEKPTTKAHEFKAVFNVPFSAGVLKAVGVDNNKEWECRILKTAGATAKITLKADRKRISANGQDLSFVMVELTDANGNLQPNADNQLSFSVEGAGLIAGVDNANLKDPDAYVAHTRKAWKGRAMVVIKSTHKAGNIKLTVSSQGLPLAVTTITAVSKR